MKIQINDKMKRFNYLCSEMNGLYHEAALKLGLSDSEFTILYGVYDADGQCPLSKICRNSGISRQTINSAVRRLERQGLISLKNHNGREKDVLFTKQGQKFAENGIAAVVAIENGILDSWTEEEYRQYMELTARYVEALQQKVAQMSWQKERDRT